MSAAAGLPPPQEWYLARDGEQFGPLSDVELRKLVEFGHLKPTDLLWREGFPDWRPARILIPEPQSSSPAEPQPASAPDQPSNPPAQAADKPAQHDPSKTQAPAQIAAAQQQPHAAGAATPNMVSGPAAAGAPVQGPRTGPVTAPNTATGYPRQPDQGPQTRAQTSPPHAGQPAAHSYVPQPTRQPAPTPQGSSIHASAQAHLPQQPGWNAQQPIDLARPGPAAPVARSTRRASAAPVHRPELDDEFDDDDGGEDGSRGVVWLKRVAVLLFFSLTLAAAGWYAYPYRDRLLRLMPKVASAVIGASASPIVGFQPTVELTDQALQKSELWRVLKRDFPDWYTERVKEAASLAGAKKDDAEIGRVMIKSIIELRRKHAGDALSATVPKLATLASSFADNLVRLRQVSVEACHAFIATGESSTDYLRLLADPNHTRALQAQMVAVFEAISDGRKVPRVYPQPKQSDYNLLVQSLVARGWTEDDMQLFSDGSRFAKAPPEKVCKMVTDWFQTQITLEQPDAQLRLLADALKPVVAG